MSAIQKALDKMNENRAVAKDKGTFGEQAVIEIVREYQSLRGGILHHSFSYRYASNRQGTNYPGNIHRESNGKFISKDGSSNTYDEIDILYLTPYRIFAIEAKARGGVWRLDGTWCTQNGTPVDKSPIAQAEKHARHLYHNIYEYLPDGNPNYIVPMVAFVDKAKVMDSRSAEQKFYVPVTIINTLKKKIRDFDTPLQYELDLGAISRKLHEIGKGQTLV